MARSVWYVGPDGQKVTWASAVSGGKAAVEISRIVQDDAGWRQELWRRVGQPVDAWALSVAQYEPSGAVAPTAPTPTPTALSRSRILTPSGGDDYAHVMQVLDNIGSAGGGNVILAPGTWYFATTPEVHYDNIDIGGCGAGTVWQTTQPDMDALRIGDGTATRSNVRVHDMLFNNSSGIKTGGTGIKINKGYKVWLERLLVTQQYRALHALNTTALWFSSSDIRNTKQDGIVIESDYMQGFEWYLDRVLCDNPDVTSVGTGLAWLGGESLHVTDCNFQRFNVGLLINPGGGRECRFGFLDRVLCDFAADNNVRITNTGTGNVVGVEFSSSWAGTATNYGLLMDRPGSGIVQGVKWVGGKVFHNGLAGVRFAGGQDLHIALAEIIGNSQSVSAARHGVEVAGALRNWSVTGCRIGGGYEQGNTHGYAIQVDAGAADYYRIVQNDCSTGNNNTPTINDLGTGTHKVVTNNL
jgi:hypothetical protein